MLSEPLRHPKITVLIYGAKKVRYLAQQSASITECVRQPSMRERNCLVNSIGNTGPCISCVLGDAVSTLLFQFISQWKGGDASEDLYHGAPIELVAY